MRKWTSKIIIFNQAVSAVKSTFKNQLSIGIGEKNKVKNIKKSINY